MQTPGEKKLIKTIILELKKCKKTPRILNIGAGNSLIIEKELDHSGCSYIEDRVDVFNCEVKYKTVEKSWTSSVENMPVVSSQNYDLSFANYVLEHVPRLDHAASEIFRTLKNNSKFVTTLPNTQAPEFKLAKFTPLWFHQFVRGHGVGHEAHETFYSYKNIAEFIKIFEKAGFKKDKIYYFPNTIGYLYRFPIINLLSILYDWIIKTIRINSLMGNVCVVFRK